MSNDDKLVLNKLKFDNLKYNLKSAHKISKFMTLILCGSLVAGVCSAESRVGSNSSTPASSAILQSNVQSNAQSSNANNTYNNTNTLATGSLSNVTQPNTKPDNSRLQPLTPASATKKPQSNAPQMAVIHSASNGSTSNNSTSNNSASNGLSSNNVSATNNVFYSPAALVPMLKNPVNDFTNTLSRQELDTLNQKLNRVYAEGKLQPGVVIVPTTGEYSIYDYSLAVAQNWQLGSTEKNNGLVMLVSLNDRQLYILTGTGVQDKLTDDFIKSAINSYVVPEFKIGHYMHGIDYGLDAIVEKMR